MSRNLDPLAHLSDDMKRFYRRTVRAFQLAGHHKRLLVCAAESHDRMTQARALLVREGITTVDRHGQVRPHPAVAIERDSRIGFARLLRELGLADEADTARPPALPRRYAGRD